MTAALCEAAKNATPLVLRSFTETGKDQEKRLRRRQRLTMNIGAFWQSPEQKFKVRMQELAEKVKAAEAKVAPQPTVPYVPAAPVDPPAARRGQSITLEFCRWLHENFDLLISEAAKEEMIQQAHADAAAEVALGTPEERKHKVFAAGTGDKA